MYRAFGLLDPSSDYSPEAAAARLAAEFPGYAVAADGPRVRLARGDWAIELSLAAGPDVLAESRRIAEHMGGLIEDADVARCDRRVEVGSDTPDPELEHFDEFQRVIGVLKTFRGLIAVDPAEPSFL
jgi:hypothetical protein